MAKLVKVEGRTISVPDDATPDEIDEIANPGSAAVNQRPQIKAPAIKMEESNLGKVVPAADAVGNVITGARKGLAHTISGTREALYNGTPAGMRDMVFPSKPDTTPVGTAQKVGYTGEQIGEYLVPSGAEAKLGKVAAEIAPRAARFAGPAARVIAQAIDSGAINKAQGGEFGSGAAVGAATGGAGEAMRAVAPKVAETALGITKRMRGYGKTPGEAVVNEIRGVRPDTILKNATSKTSALTADVNGMAASQPGTVSLKSAIQTIDGEIAKATKQNNATAIEQLGRLKDSLTTEAVTGKPIPVDVPASRALDLKRGVREQFVKNWNPDLMSGTRAVAARSSGAIDKTLDSAIGPEFSTTNQRLSSLIPVADRAESLERDPSLVQRMGHRVAAHTGALAGSAAGSVLGYREGGVKGGIAGGVLGIGIPEAISSPTVQMMAARALNSRITPALGRGIALQLDRSDKKNPEDEQ